MIESNCLIWRILTSVFCLRRAGVNAGSFSLQKKQLLIFRSRAVPWGDSYSMNKSSWFHLITIDEMKQALGMQSRAWSFEAFDYQYPMISKDWCDHQPDSMVKECFIIVNKLSCFNCHNVALYATNITIIN